jgi:hypothetical protein
MGFFFYRKLAEKKNLHSKVHAESAVCIFTYYEPYVRIYFCVVTQSQDFGMGQINYPLGNLYLT